MRARNWRRPDHFLIAAETVDGVWAVRLTRHPGTHAGAVHGVSAKVRTVPGGAIALSYLLEADLSRLRIAPRGAGSRADGLWQHTCFEAFFAGYDVSAYLEFNFAPSGDWALYAFSHYRERMPLMNAPAPEIAVRSAGNRLALETVLRREHFAQLGSGARWRVALSAVIEDERTALGYWALKHPPGKPDFHHPDGFVLDLQPVPFSSAKEGSQ